MPHKLLLADDSVTIQRVIELTFADEDIEVTTASDGQEAIEQLDRTPPDIVLVDASLPKRDGYAVAAHVKETPRLSGIPVLLLAGAFEPVDEARAQTSGCHGVLAKPFEPQMVIERVMSALGLAASGDGERSHASELSLRVAGTPHPAPRIAPAATAPKVAPAAPAAAPDDRSKDPVDDEDDGREGDAPGARASLAALGGPRDASGRNGTSKSAQESGGAPSPASAVPLTLGDIELPMGTSADDLTAADLPMPELPVEPAVEAAAAAPSLSLDEYFDQLNAVFSDFEQQQEAAEPTAPVNREPVEDGESVAAAPQTAPPVGERRSVEPIAPFESVDGAIEAVSPAVDVSEDALFDPEKTLPVVAPEVSGVRAIDDGGLTTEMPEAPQAADADVPAGARPAPTPIPARPADESARAPEVVAKAPVGAEAEADAESEAGIGMPPPAAPSPWASSLPPRDLPAFDFSDLPGMGGGAAAPTPVPARVAAAASELEGREPSARTLMPHDKNEGERTPVQARRTPPPPAAVAPVAADAERPVAGKVPDLFAELLAAEKGRVERTRPAPAPRVSPSSARPRPTVSPSNGISHASAPLVVTEELVERVSQRVLSRLSDRVVRETVSSMVAELAERLVREEIARVKQQAATD